MHDVIVIGGGIAGLTTAWKTSRMGLNTVVIEAHSETGGNIRTIDHGGFRLELGPYSFMGSSEYIWELVDELGIEDLAEPSQAAADNRFIYRDGRLQPLPLSPLGFLGTKLLSSRAKFRLMLEPFIRNGAKPHDTAWEFFVRRFGLEAATYVMGPFVSGVYAGDPRMLGARAAFPKFHNFERDSGSMIIGSLKYMLAKRHRMAREHKKVHKGLYSFNGGLGTVTSILAERLGSRVITGQPVTGLQHHAGIYTVSTAAGQWQARAVVSAVPPNIAAPLLGSLAPAVVDPLQAIPMSPVTVIHWSQEHANGDVPNGFGFLMPRIYDLRVLGTVFASQLFTGRAPAGQLLFSSFYGGMLDKPAMDLSDDELSATVLAEHARIFGHDVATPSMMKILRYPGAIPQLLPDHPERISLVRQHLTAVPGLFLAGNYLSGVGVEHAVTSGYNAANEVERFFAESPRRNSKEAGQ